MHGENGPPLTLTFPLRVKRILVISEGQELHSASLSLTTRSTIRNVDIKAHLVKAWEMML